MIKRSYARHPDFDKVVKAYRDRYGIDLSHMRMRWSKHPVYTDGVRSRDFEDNETGGSWRNDSSIAINPDMKSVMERFGITGQTQAEFRRRIIAHELAHEVYRKKKAKELIRVMLEKAKEENFTTPYLQTVPDRKMDEETFAEYMSDQLNKKASFLSRVVRSPSLRRLPITDRNVSRMVEPYMGRLRSRMPQIGEPLVRNPKTTLGEFVDAYRRVGRDIATAEAGGPVKKAPTVRPGFDSLIKNPFSLRTGEAWQSYEELVRRYGRKRADELARGFMDSLESQGFGGLAGEMKALGISPRMSYEVLSNPRTVLRGSARDILARRARSNARRYGGSGYLLSRFDPNGKAEMISSDLIPIDIPGEVGTYLTPRQRAIASRQMRQYLTKSLGDVPRSVEGRPIRYQVSKYVVENPGQSNGGFTPVNLRSLRPANYDTLAFKTEPYIEREGSPSLRPLAIVESPLIRGRDGRMYLSGDTARHETGHAMARASGHAYEVPETHRGLIGVNPFLSRNGDLPGEEVIADELAANLRGKVGNRNTGETPSLFSYYLSLAKTPEQKRYAIEGAKRLGVYRSPFS